MLIAITACYLKTSRQKYPYIAGRDGVQDFYRGRGLNNKKSAFQANIMEPFRVGGSFEQLSGGRSLLS
jgi:hypothetical protein